MDPNKIRHARRHLTVAGFLEEPAPEGEPAEVTPERMTALVEMVITNGPLPQVVLLERADGTRRVGAGAGLLAACRAFHAGARLHGPALSFLSDWANLALKDLPPWCQRRFLRREVDVCLIEPGTPEDVASAVMAALAQG